MKNKGKYVLLTAAHNEAAYIEATIRSVARQTILPERWVIVSDGSTDGTDGIIQACRQEHPFLHYERKEKNEANIDFGSKVLALRQGYECLAGCDYDFIGILDADITFAERYFEKLFGEFAQNERLGIAGGLLYEEHNGRFMPRPLSETRYVPGAVHLFRRSCYEQVGGFIPSKWGGEDTIAVVTARMRGWETKSINNIPAYHHKNSEASRGYLKERFRSGVMFYAMGSHPLFEVLKSLRQMGQKPLLVGGLARIWGYTWAACTMTTRPVSAEFITYLRQEQWARLRSTQSAAIS